MNPIASSVDRAALPPMAEVRKTLRIGWYRCPIEKERLRELSRPDDVEGLKQSLGHFGLWCATGVITYWCYSRGFWPGFFLALFLHGTVGTFFTAPHHELCHRTVFKTKILNDIFLYLFSLLGWLNFRIYQFSHNYHHRFTLFPEGDREEVMPATPSLRALYLLQLFTFNVMGGYQSRGVVPTVRNFVDIAMNRFENPFNSWGAELYEGHDRQRQKAVGWARTVLLFHTLFLLFALAIGQPVLVLLVSLSPFTANALRYFVGVPMHCGLHSNIADFRKCARTITLDPFSRFLYWHMNYHLEHHMYGGVPCYNLGALHRALEDDMPKPRTLVGAWREMRETWKKQKTDPEYVFDTPLPDSFPEPRDSSSKTGYAAEPDGLSASLGELGPAEINEDPDR